MRHLGARGQVKVKNKIVVELTVAYPHGVLALCSIDSNISLPTSRK